MTSERTSLLRKVIFVVVKLFLDVLYYIFVLHIFRFFANVLKKKLFVCVINRSLDECHTKSCKALHAFSSSVKILFCAHETKR